MLFQMYERGEKAKEGSHDGHGVVVEDGRNIF